MITSFKSRALKNYWEKADASALGQNVAKIKRILDQLNVSKRPEDMNIPGSYFHKLHGSPTRYSVRVTGNLRITFEWDVNDAFRVDLEDYH